MYELILNYPVVGLLKVAKRQFLMNAILLVWCKVSEWVPKGIQ